MDTYILHKAFLAYRAEPDMQEPDNFLFDKIEIDIRYQERELKDLKDTFVGRYSRIIRILVPKLNRMRNYVHIPECGGTVEVIEDGYPDVYEEYLNEFAQVERLYLLIIDTEKCIEHLWNKKRENEIKKIADRYRSKYFFNAWICPRNPKQLTLFDDYE